jgi:hypothetical protein
MVCTPPVVKTWAQGATTPEVTALVQVLVTPPATSVNNTVPVGRALPLLPGVIVALKATGTWLVTTVLGLTERLSVVADDATVVEKVCELALKLLSPV